MPHTAPRPVNVTEAELRRVFDQLRENTSAMASTTARERCRRLISLKKSILNHREEIQNALASDFGKPARETDFSEILTVTTEISKTVSELRYWMQAKSVPTPLSLLGNRSTILMQPKGVVLIISPWNFPINLCLTPLVSAIAAGNTICLKPSEFTPASTRVMKTILKEVFPENEVALVEGDAQIGDMLVQLPFHHIFFTGSPRVGSIVMQHAAKNLTSVTLELGGKSPAIIDETANLGLAANRIVWSKFYNAGQICIAPDYVLIPAHLCETFVSHLRKVIIQFYGDQPQHSPDFARIIHDRHFQKLKDMLDNAVANGTQVRIGGQTDASERYIAPTVVTNTTPDCLLMQEEIFGPIMPVITYTTIDEALSLIRSFPTPLAAYIFSEKKTNRDYLMSQTRAGNSAVNTALAQFFNDDLPFGGDHHSGFGKTHGYFGFQAFSNMRSVLYQPFRWSAVDLVQPPFTFITRRLADFFLRWF